MTVTAFPISIKVQVVVAGRCDFIFFNNETQRRLVADRRYPLAKQTQILRNLGTDLRQVIFIDLASLCSKTKAVVIDLEESDCVGLLGK